MRTVKQIVVGHRAVVIRSNGQVYLAEREDSAFPVDRSAKLAATSSPGCQAMADAFAEAGRWMREHRDELVDK
jgi:hypothetical protein